MINPINEHPRFRDSAERIHERKKHISTHQCNVMTIWFVVAVVVAGWLYVMHRIGAI